MSILYHIIRGILHVLLNIFFPVKYVGRENMPKEGGLIVCSNHLSYIDPVFFIKGLPRQIHFMAKEELFRNPLIRAFLHGIGAFAVNRGKDGGQAVAHSIDIVKSGKVMGIFPEGTRSKTGVPGRAKSGVAMIAGGSGADVLPIAVCPKTGRVKMFKKTVVAVGKVIPAEEIAITDMTDRRQIRAASERIMNEIKTLWENNSPTSK